MTQEVLVIAKRDYLIAVFTAFMIGLSIGDGVGHDVRAWWDRMTRPAAPAALFSGGSGITYTPAVGTVIVSGGSNAVGTTWSGIIVGSSRANVWMRDGRRVFCTPDGNWVDVDVVAAQTTQ